MPNRWFSALLGFFFPPVAFLYLSLFRWALLYFVLLLVSAIADFALIKEVGASGLSLVLSIICAIHAFKLSKTTAFPNGRKWFNRWWGALSIPVCIFLVIFLFRSFLYEIFQIPSASMVPTLKVGDHIVVSKPGYGTYGSFGITVYETEIEERENPKRGEVFVLYPPGNKSLFVERVIGLPNDVIAFSDKQLRINGELVKTRKTGNPNIYEETLDGNTYKVQYLYDDNPYRTVKFRVPENSYFVMGDNRDNSSDSRVWGFVPSENIVGKVVYIWD